MKQGKINIEKQLTACIRASYIKQLLVPSIMVAVICFLLLKIPFSDILVPKTIDDLNSLSLKNKHSIEYFQISGKNWLYSGYDKYNNKNEIVGHIFYRLDNDTCYFLLVSPDFVAKSDMSIKTDNINVSVSERTDSYNSFLHSFALDINWNFEDLNEITSQMLLNTTSYNITFYKLLYIVLICMIAYLAITIVYFMSVIIFPLLSPQLGTKHRHSAESIKSRSEFSMLLQSELDNYIYSADNIYITKNYIMNLTSGEICIIPLTKLCFLFEHGNLHKLLWFYMKVTHTIYFLCDNGLKCHFTYRNSGNIDELMNILKGIIPDLMFGYSSENQTEYLRILKEKRH